MEKEMQLKIPRGRRNFDLDFGCPVQATLDVIGGKWKGKILFHLGTKTRRFNELRRLLPDTTHRMLTLQLRELERDGVVLRTSYAEMPPRVEYQLTELGGSLRPIVLLMRRWGEDYMRKALKARARAS
jgi:DNA-binding HxlR family transcriptional regulator